MATCDTQAGDLFLLLDGDIRPKEQVTESGPGRDRTCDQPLMSSRVIGLALELIYHICLRKYGSPFVVQ